MKAKWIVRIGTLAAAGLVVATAALAKDKDETAASKPAAKTGVKLGEAAPDFKLKDLDGKDHTLAQYKGKPVVLVFVSNECPWSKGSDPDLSKIANEYKAKGVTVIGIDSDKGHSPEQIKEYAKTANIGYVVLKDDQNVYADAVGAKQTPEVFLLDKEGKLVYHGAVDDRASETVAGKTSYIRAALDETLAGKPVSTPEKKQWGCGINRAAKREGS